MSLNDALNTFYEESREMLEEMEGILLALERDLGENTDTEQLNSLFRCVHTIKGSAGLFGLEHVVEFTHVVENVLDRVRGGMVELDRDLMEILLNCRDHIGSLVELDAESVTQEITQAGDALLKQLAAYQEGDSQAEDSGEQQAAPAQQAAEEVNADAVASDSWHISLRFGSDIYRHGMDPLGFIRYLGTLGKITYVNTLTSALPAAEDMDPESCYLGFEVDLRADTDKATIESVFEFVMDDAELHILPPRSALQRYMELIQALPEDEARLGEMLVASGALTQAELDEGLRRQQAAAEGGDEAPRIGEVLVDSGDVQQEVVDAAVDKQQEAKGNRGQQQQASQHIRVQADKLDSLINLVGELVIASASAGVAAQRNGDSATSEAIGRVTTLVEEIRDGSLGLRMVPIGETFQRFERVVRDVSRELEKDIRLEISGAETELDKTVVEKIGDPLTHLVRNAMDHGIESAERRLQAGKPKQGMVHLNAFHEAGNIAIEVRDDGGGLNSDKILAKALERGVIQTADGLSEQDIFQLVFEPGFSTADQISNLSGRGVGMDVVKRNIEALRGSVEVDSTPGAGSIFRVRLPLTLAIIDGFLMRVGEASYVVPLENVNECVELTAEQREEARRHNFVDLRGEVLPILRLREYFNLAGEMGKRENIVVVGHGGQKVGLVVDELQGENQTVIKPLGKLFANLGGISGSTILGSGDVALILDVPSLLQRTVDMEARANKRRSDPRARAAYERS